MKPLVQTISVNYVVLVLSCENYNEAIEIDSKLDEHVIRWDKPTEDGEVYFVLKSPQLGTYQFKGYKPFVTNLENVSFIAVAYPSKTGQGLELLAERVLNRLTHPMS